MQSKCSVAYFKQPVQGVSPALKCCFNVQLHIFLSSFVCQANLLQGMIFAYVNSFMPSTSNKRHLNPGENFLNVFQIDCQYNLALLKLIMVTKNCNRRKILIFLN